MLRVAAGTRLALLLLASGIASACYDTLPPPGSFETSGDGGSADGDVGNGEIDIAVFRANPESVAYGETALITFNVRGAKLLDLVVVDGPALFTMSSTLAGQVRTSSLTATTQFELTAVGETETLKRRTTISVIPTAHASIETATAAAVIAPGASSLLEWRASGAHAGKLRRLDGSTVYDIPAGELESGRFTLRPTTTSVYELGFTGADGQEVTETVLVRVADPGMDLDARARFAAEVQGTLEARCAPCHARADVRGPDFLGVGGPDGYYDLLVGSPRFLGRPEDSLLFLKGEHAGPALTAVARGSVAAWLLQEIAERKIPRAPKGAQPYAPRSLREALVRAGACWTRADWDATYRRDAAGHTTEAAYEVTTPRGGQGGGPCYACHEVGTGGVFLRMDGAAMLGEMRALPAILKVLSPDYGPDGLRGLVLSDRLTAKGMDDLHPAYTLSADRQQAVRDLGERVLARDRDFTLRCDQEN